MHHVDNVHVINPPDPISADQLLTGEIVQQWAAEATKNITQDDDRENEIHFIETPSPMGSGKQAVPMGNDDCACTGVEVGVSMYHVENVNLGATQLPTISNQSDLTDKVVKLEPWMSEEQLEVVEHGLWRKKFSSQYSFDPDKVFTLVIGGQTTALGEFNYNLYGHVSLAPSGYILTLMLESNDWDWTVVTHELGHYIGINAHWNENEHPNRIIASSPHDRRTYPGWITRGDIGPTVTMTREECAYWRGAWDRLSLDTMFFAEGKHDPHFSYYTESLKESWEYWRNNADYLYLEPPISQ